MNPQDREHEITAYLLGELDPERAQAVKELLEESEECQALAQDLELTLGLLRDALADSPEETLVLEPSRKAAVVAVPEEVVPTKKGRLVWLRQNQRMVANVAALFVAAFISVGVLQLLDEDSRVSDSAAYVTDEPSSLYFDSKEASAPAGSNSASPRMQPDATHWDDQAEELEVVDEQSLMESVDGGIVVPMGGGVAEARFEDEKLREVRLALELKKDMDRSSLSSGSIVFEAGESSPEARRRFLKEGKSIDGEAISGGGGGGGSGVRDTSQKSDQLLSKREVSPSDSPADGNQAWERTAKEEGAPELADTPLLGKLFKSKSGEVINESSPDASATGALASGEKGAVTAKASNFSGALVGADKNGEERDLSFSEQPSASRIVRKAPTALAGPTAPAPVSQPAPSAPATPASLLDPAAPPEPGAREFGNKRPQVVKKLAQDSLDVAAAKAPAPMVSAPVVPAPEPAANRDYAFRSKMPGSVRGEPALAIPTPPITTVESSGVVVHSGPVAPNDGKDASVRWYGADGREQAATKESIEDLQASVRGFAVGGAGRQSARDQSADDLNLGSLQEGGFSGQGRDAMARMPKIAPLDHVNGDRGGASVVMDREESQENGRRVTRNATESDKYAGEALLAPAADFDSHGLVDAGAATKARALKSTESPSSFGIASETLPAENVSRLSELETKPIGGDEALEGVAKALKPQIVSSNDDLTYRMDGVNEAREKAKANSPARVADSRSRSNASEGRVDEIAGHWNFPGKGLEGEQKAQPAQPEVSLAAKLDGAVVFAEGVELEESDDDLISVSLDDVPMSDVIRMFSRISGANIIGASDPVLEKTVSIEVKDEPWGEVMERILDEVGADLVEKQPGIYTVQISEKEPELPSVYRAASFNPYVSTAENALSTFAIDVDDASYTLTRSHMTQGALPPAEAVRTEEFVNAFRYRYPAPSSGTFAIHKALAPAPFGEGHLLQIGVKGKVIGRDQQRPATLTFVIDTSGSMDTPDRLGLAKTSLKMLIDHLNPADRVAIVQYDVTARTVLNPTPASERLSIVAALDQLQISGSTNLEEGIRQGYALAARAFDPDGVNRVLLISDGMANLGNADAEKILGQVEGFRRQGISCSIFGFGLGNYNDEMLETLANKGDGVYRFIDSEKEAKKVFVDDLAATLNYIARDVKIQVEFNPQRVKRYRQLGYENRQLKAEQFRDDSVDAGEVGSGQSVTALYELDLIGSPRDVIGTARLRYADIETGEVEEIEQEITVSDVLRDYADADDGFKLAAGVAEFAELLRGSPYAEGSDFAAVAEVIRPVAQAQPLDQRIQELLQLVQAAKGMPRSGQ